MFKIVEKGTKSPKEDFIKISGINISMNSSFIENNKLMEKEFVNVYLDEIADKFLIGFEFLVEEEENSFKLSRTKGQKGRFVSASSLFKKINLDPQKYKEDYLKAQVKEFNGKKLFVIEILKK